MSAFSLRSADANSRERQREVAREGGKPGNQEEEGGKEVEGWGQREFAALAN